MNKMTEILKTSEGSVIDVCSII